MGSARYLTARQIAGITFRLVGAFAVVRLIGPADYGRYAVAMSVVGLLVVVAGAGLSLSLIRRAEPPTRGQEDQAASLLLVTSAAAVAVGLALGLPLLRLAVGADYVPVYVAVLFTVPLNVAWIPAFARLERSFRHRELSVAELGSELAGYAVAIALAAGGAGVWAPVAGAYVVQLWQLVASGRLAGYRMRWRWSTPDAASLVRTGSPETASSWILQAGDLVAPLVAAHYLGAAAAGQLAVARRLVDVLAVVKRTSSRLALPTLSRVRHEPDRLREAHAAGRVLGILGTGPVMAVGAALLVMTVPVVLGAEWEPLPRLVALSCVSSLVGMAFALHSSVLAIVGRQGPVIVLRLVQLALLTAGSVVLMPRHGAIGFPLAELVRCAGFVVVELAVRQVLRPDSREVWLWIAAWTVPLGAAFVGPVWWPLLCVAPLAVAVSPAGRRRLRQVLDLARSRGQRSGGGDPVTAV